MKRWCAVIALALGLLVGGASAASAIDIPNPIGDAILDKICPPRQAPYPASPGGPVVQRGGGPGLYANYDYAGLRWTTYDAGCLSWDKADTSIGSQVNAAANSLDQLVNEMQIAALDDATTASFDDVIVRALGGLHDAFWNKWSAAGLAAVGVLLVLYIASGRATAALSLVLGACTVTALLFTLMAQPTLPARISNGMTSGVATGVADSLIKVTPDGAMPASATSKERFGEGFYQVSYRAWLEGSFCGDADAERVYGRRLLDAQAFTVAQLQQTRNDPAAQKRLVEQKQQAWADIGKDMAKTHPAAFGCWKGEGTSRTGAAVKHAVVTLTAGFWLVAGSLALLALKWVLRLALLFFVAFSALLLFSTRLQDRMQEFVLLGLIGPPFVAAGVGTLLWGYYAILLTGDQAWWQAGVAAFALGLAMWFSKGILQRLFVGMSAVHRGGDAMRHGGRRFSRYSSSGGHYSTPSSGSSLGDVAVGGVVGGAAGAATAAVLTHHDSSDDERREEPVAAPHATEHEADAPREAGVGDPALAGMTAPQQALARVRRARSLEEQFDDVPPPDVFDDERRDDEDPTVAAAQQRLTTEGSADDLRVDS